MIKVNTIKCKGFIMLQHFVRDSQSIYDLPIEYLP